MMVLYLPEMYNMEQDSADSGAPAWDFGLCRLIRIPTQEINPRHYHWAEGARV